MENQYKKGYIDKEMKITQKTDNDMAKEINYVRDSLGVIRNFKNHYYKDYNNLTNLIVEGKLQSRANDFENKAAEAEGTEKDSV